MFTNTSLVLGLTKKIKDVFTITSLQVKCNDCNNNLIVMFFSHNGWVGGKKYKFFKVVVGTKIITIGCVHIIDKQTNMINKKQRLMTETYSRPMYHML